MATVYSDVTLSKTISDDDGIRQYKSLKLGSREVFIEGLKLVKVLTPSIGTAIDQLQNTDDIFGDISHTYGAAMQHLMDNIEPEHFAELCDKLLGKLFVNDKEVDYSTHFDKYPQDFIDVIWWLGDTTFRPFLLKNAIVQSLMSKMTDQKMGEKLKNFVSL